MYCISYEDGQTGGEGCFRGPSICSIDAQQHKAKDANETVKIRFILSFVRTSTEMHTGCRVGLRGVLLHSAVPTLPTERTVLQHLNQIRKKTDVRTGAV